MRGPYPYEAWHCWRAGVVYQARPPAQWQAWVRAQQRRWRVLLGGRAS
jgi:hypothetical protein